jgi:TorA maturation chaperone TorD
VSVAYNNDAGIRALIDSFGGSEESKALYSGDTTSFVTAIYKNIFSRAPDAEGLNFWVDAIDHHGLTKANASLSIMAGALANTSSQGKLDAALVNNRTAIASDFSFALDTPSEVLAYSGNAAAAAVRAMLATVTASTDLAAFQATVQSTLAHMPLDTGLVGVAEHNGALFH